MMTRYLTPFKVFYISIIERMYEYFNKQSNNYRSQDPLFILGIVIQKNQSLVKNQRLNLEEYLCGDYEKAEHIADTVLKFYEGL